MFDLISLITFVSFRMWAINCRWCRHVQLSPRGDCKVLWWSSSTVQQILWLLSKSCSC